MPAKPTKPPEPILSDLSEAAQILASPDPAILDDIPDPDVPRAVQEAMMTPAPPLLGGDTFGAHEALFLGFAQQVQRKLHELLVYDHKSLAQSYDATFDLVKKWLESTVLTQQRADLDQAVFEALATRPASPPYSVTVQAVSPGGYVVQFRVEQPDAGSLVDEVQRLTGWLAAQQYTAIPSAVAF